MVSCAMRSCLPDDMWDNGSLDDGPSPMASHTAVWTGSLMLVWTGKNFSEGWLYDPAADTWTLISTANARPPYPSEGFPISPARA